MNYLKYWARYVRKGEVKSGGIKNGNESAPWIKEGENPKDHTWGWGQILAGLAYQRGQWVECAGKKPPQYLFQMEKGKLKCLRKEKYLLIMRFTCL